MQSRRAVLRSLMTLGSAVACGKFSHARPAQAGLGVAGVPERIPIGPAWPITASGSVASDDGTRIFFRSAGEGERTLLLVHGWSCNHRFFAPQFAALAEHHRVIAVDLAGHGSSARRDSHTVPAFADDVQAVADTVEGPLVLVVHSAGGRVACAAAKRLGERLLGVVGIDSFQNLGMPAPDPAQIESALAAMRADFSGRIAASMDFFFPSESDPSLVKWVQAQMGATDPEQAISAASAYANFDATAAITGFAKPVIALNSDGLPTDIEAIRQHVSDFDARIFPGHGHFLHLAHWERFNNVLLKALEGIWHRAT